MQAVASVAETLKPGGLVFLRDYAEGDLAEDKLSQKDSLKCISPHFYVRGDGTRAFYFTEVCRSPSPLASVPLHTPFMAKMVVSGEGEELGGGGGYVNCIQQIQDGLSSDPWKMCPTISQVDITSLSFSHPPLRDRHL